jgi:hypothetical protein
MPESLKSEEVSQVAANIRVTPLPFESELPERKQIRSERAQIRAHDRASPQRDKRIFFSKGRGDLKDCSRHRSHRWVRFARNCAWHKRPRAAQKMRNYQCRNSLPRRSVYKKRWHGNCSFPQSIALYFNRASQSRSHYSRFRRASWRPLRVQMEPILEHPDPPFQIPAAVFAGLAPGCEE